MTDEMTKQTPDGELIRSLWQEARELIKRLEGSTVQRLAIEAGEYKIEIERGAPTVTVAAVGAGPVPLTTGVAPAVTEEPAEDKGHPIVSPLVGTFYRSAQPGAKVFVEEGDVVDAGQTIGIVEAMKIMNQVKADQPGKVVEIVAKDGDWVEFQQPLMYLGPIGG